MVLHCEWHATFLLYILLIRYSFDYFYNQNELIKNGSSLGVALNFDSLTVINGIIDQYIQAPYYPEFALHNTYNITAYNQSVYQYSQYALYMSYGCLQQLEGCFEVDQTTLSGQAICAEAANMCRDNVEGLYYNFGDRGVYDIRHPYDDPTPADYFVDYLNLPAIQAAIGVVSTSLANNLSNLADGKLDRTLTTAALTTRFTLHSSRLVTLGT